MHVIVIGAGLGGLCLAQRLRRTASAFPYTSRTPRRSSATRATASMSTPTAVAPSNTPSHHGCGSCSWPPPGHGPRSVFLDEQLVARWTAEAEPGPAPLAVDRLTLRQILLSGMEDIVTFDKACTGFETTPADDVAATANSRVTAHFADGSTVTGDVLVAADGVNSVIRRQLLPHARVVDTGLRQLYGKIPLNDQTGRCSATTCSTSSPRSSAPSTPSSGWRRWSSEPIHQAAVRHAPAVRLHAVRTT